LLYCRWNATYQIWKAMCTYHAFTFSTFYLLKNPFLYIIALNSLGRESREVQASRCLPTRPTNKWVSHEKERRYIFSAFWGYLNQFDIKFYIYIYIYIDISWKHEHEYSRGKIGIFRCCKLHTTSRVSKSLCMRAQIFLKTVKPFWRETLLLVCTYTLP
jgi:hypothetical protein